MQDEDSIKNESVAEIYNRAAARFDREGPRFFSHFGSRLVDLAHVEPSAKVLEVATGRGAILFPAANQAGPDGAAIGVDIAAGMVNATLAEAQRAGLKQVMMCQMDAEHLAFPRAWFSAVLCGNAIYYFPGALDEFFRVLAPGGPVGLSVIAKGCLDWILETLQPYFPEEDTQNDDEEQETINSPQGLETALSKAGFQNSRCFEEEACFTYSSEEEWWATMWTLGCSGMMKAMSPVTLERFRLDLNERLQVFKKPAGIAIPIRVLFAYGNKP